MKPQFPLLATMAVAVSFLGSPTAAQQSHTPSKDWRERLANAQLLLSFQGKGSSLPYDAGVVSEMFPRVPAFRQQRVIVTGNSSGSILAAYFACFGFTETSVRYSDYRLLHADRSEVREMESGTTKTVKILRNQQTEIPYMVLCEYIAFALGVQDWQSATSINDIVYRSLRAAFPVVIAAANHEVLNSELPGKMLESANLKEFNYDNFDVSWKQEVYDFYRQHPERFAREHPDLKMGSDRRIGKAMTFFVDQSMFNLLQQIPPEQRTADLRLMKTPGDVAVAILASAAEPTYFRPVEDPNPGKLFVGQRMGDLGNSRRRVYSGGFILPLVAQDIRRMLPGIRVVGSGWTHNPLAPRQFLKTHYLVDVERLAHLSCWWADMEMNPDRALQKRIVAHDLPAEAEFEAGRAQARACLDTNQALPTYAAPPRHRSPAENAIWPAHPAGREMSPPGWGDANELRTFRGLEPLISPDKSAQQEKAAP